MTSTDGSRSTGCGQRLRSTSNPTLPWRRSSATAPSRRPGFPARHAPPRPFGPGVVFVAPRLAALGVRCILPRADIRPALAAAGLAETGFPDYDRLRLELGIPDGSLDLVPEKSILLESGFDELNGVDWQKGCYIGQELTARTKYRGLIKKRLMPVEIDGPAPAPGTIVSAGGRGGGGKGSSPGGG